MSLIKVKGRGAENLGRRRLNPNGVACWYLKSNNKSNSYRWLQLS